MSIVVVGASHDSAPLPFLERLSIPPGELGSALTTLQPQVREAFALSTCNRTEVYAVTGHATSGADILLGFLASHAGVARDELASCSYTLSGEVAVDHLLRVASGLDSMVLGEDQIQAQLRRALDAARDAGSLGPMLDRLGAAALGCGKRVRTFTGLGRHSVSLESLAVRAVTARIGDLAGRPVLVLGSGESARLVAQQLRRAGADITVLGRRIERAQALATACGARAGALSDLTTHLEDADVVFCCTSAPHPVVTSDALPPRPLLCVDLGMPRDVDPAVAHLPGVSVITLAELRVLADAHRREREAHIPAAEKIAREEAARFMAWRRARATAATSAALRAHADGVAEREVTRALDRLSTLTPAQREIVQELARRLVGKLLHAPMETLRSHPEAENVAVGLAVAFNLPGASAALESLLPPSTNSGADAPQHIEDAAS